MLVHGGMAQNVGPILEMVTEKYLLRCDAEWKARQSMLGILDEILAALRAGTCRAIGAATTRNFRQPIQTIIPWATNYFTETLIERVQAEFGDGFLGLLDAGRHVRRRHGLHLRAGAEGARADSACRRSCPPPSANSQHALPFAMEPVVYDFAINERGTFADLLDGAAALMPPGYYTLTVPALLRQDRHALSPLRRAELDKFGAACRTRPELRGMVQTLVRRHAAARQGGIGDRANRSPRCSNEHGFDRVQHEQIRADLKDGRIGLAQNRLPASAVIEDVQRRRRRGRRRSSSLDSCGLRGSWASTALTNGRAGGGHPGRGRRQPLDPGRGRGEGAASLLPAGRAATAPSSRRTWPRAGASRARPALPSRTSSPPAT